MMTRTELEKDLEGGDCGLIWILSQHYHGYAMENQRNFMCPDRDKKQVSTE
jgi:hypothetical protein